MKLLTLNFLTCARKLCKSNPAAFPLHPRDAELEIVEQDINVLFLQNILPRLLWKELCSITSELGLPALPTEVPTRDSLVSTTLQPKAGDTTGLEVEQVETPTQMARDLHRVLLETGIKEGKLVCGNCGHEYRVMEGVGNFLLPGHLV